MLRNSAAIGFFAAMISLGGSFAAAASLESRAPLVVEVGGQPPEELPAAEEADAETFEAGVVVESVRKGSALERAGLRQGDLILAWERLPHPPSNPQGARGWIRNYADWITLKEEEFPRGSFRLEVRRDSVLHVVEIPLTIWRIRARPVLTVAEKQCLGEIAGHIDGGGSPADSCLVNLFPRGKPSKSESAFYWLGVSLANRLAKVGRTKEAQEFLAALVAKLSLTGLQVPALWALGNINAGAGDLEAARDAYRKAAQLVESRQGKNLLWARCQTGLLAVDLIDETGMGHGEQHLELLALRQSLAPGSADVAASMSNVAVVASRNGDFEGASIYFEKALNILEDLESYSNEVATVLLNYSVALWRSGDLERAEVFARRSVDLRKQFGASSLETASSLINLGVILDERGDLRSAEEYYSEALSLVDLDPRLVPFKIIVLTNLSSLYWKRGDHARAESLLSSALSILGRPAHQDGREITLLTNLGLVERSRGKYKEARVYLNQARQLAEALAPTSIEHWSALSALAKLDLLEDRAVSSINWSHRALKVIREFSQGSPYEARSLMSLGGGYALLGQYALAERHLLESIMILEAYPGQPLERAEAFSLLAKLNMQRGEPKKAAELFEKAAQASEQASKLSGGGFQDVLRYRDSLSSLLDGHVGALAGAGVFNEAFQVLERKRARSFVALLKERDIRFGEGEAEGMIDDLRLLERKYDHLQMELLKLSESRRQVDLGKVLAKVHDANSRISQLYSRLKRVSPKMAALHEPVLLEVEGLRKAIPKDVLVLSFAVENDASIGFSLGSEAKLRCATIRLGRRDLSRKIFLFRSLLAEANGDGSMSGVRKNALDVLGLEIYNLILRPFEDEVEGHRRVVIIADGVLQLLPFGALRRWMPEGPRKSAGYVAIWKSLHYATSLSAYIESVQIVQSNGTGRFVGFGSPFVSVTAKGGAEQSLARDLLDSNSLPHSGREVETVALLFPEDQVSVFVGEEATEERAKAVGGAAKIIHFATHAQLDDRFPLSSSLILAMPADPQFGADNGLLQVWEIFEQMRLSADLVVLSACQTALGEADGGEGLMGLARAFQFAGARSVLASLWNVNDEATSELMIRFYKHLRAGLPKDQALQAAQQELIRGPVEVINEKGEREIRDFSAPYYWAGFQLYGDWQ